MDEKRSRGQPTKYKAKYCNEIIEYFNNSEGFPTFEGFANSIGVDGATIVRWTDYSNNFCAAYARAKTIQCSRLVTGAMGNKYNSQFAQFFAKNNLGFRDKTETEVSGGIRVTMSDGVDDMAD